MDDRNGNPIRCEHGRRYDGAPCEKCEAHTLDAPAPAFIVS